MRVVIGQYDGPATMRALPLAAGLLVSAVRSDEALGGECDLHIRTSRLEPSRATSRIGRADVLGLSCYTWNVRYSLAVAAEVKRARPGCVVVAGGPSVPRRPGEARDFLAARPQLDVLVFGEGERTFRAILHRVIGGRSLDDVPSLAIRGPDGVPRLTAPGERLRDFSGLGSPYLDGTFDRYLLDRGMVQAAIVETNRGCPFACTFCDWGQAVHTRVNELPLDRVAAEIEWVGQRGIGYLYIVDANFGIRPRDEALARHVGEVRSRHGAPAFCFFHLTKNATAKNLRTVELLREAGVGSQMALSMQAFDDGVLAAIKRSNIKLERSLDLREHCHRLGIPTVNELILGLPAQTLASFVRSMVKAISPNPADSFYLYLCRLLENAEMSTPDSVARYGLETRRAAVGSAQMVRAELHVSEFEDVVVATAAMPAADWRRAYRFGQLLSALYNLRLLARLVHYLRQHTVAGDLAGWMFELLDHAAHAPGDSALGRVHAVLERYADSVCADGGPLVLGDLRTPDHLWTVSEAVALVCLDDPDGFYDAIRSLTLAWHGPDAALGELLAYERLWTPAFGSRAPSEHRFAHDWPTWDKARSGEGAPPAKGEVTLRYTPPSYVSTRTWAEFASHHVRGAYSKAPPGQIDVVQGLGTSLSQVPPGSQRS